jgi:hypothetical protein
MPYPVATKTSRFQSGSASCLPTPTQIGQPKPYHVVRLRRSASVPTATQLDLYPHMVSGMAKKTAHAPLTPAVLHILLVLSTDERHGYGII